MSRGNLKRQALIRKKREMEQNELERQNTAARIDIPKVFKEWLDPYRYKVSYGGRGAGKSWAYAVLIVVKCLQKNIRVLCCREFQTNINQSVYGLLKDTIARYKLGKYFKITNNKITCTLTGSEISFTGLHFNPTEIKSYEGIDICWVEEAQSVSKQSWDVLIPTIRKEGSEIWISFNPDLETDETYQRFVVNKADNELLVKINYDQNPYFPEVLRKEMEHCKKVDPEAFDNIWDGNVRKYSNAQIFKDKFEVVEFETPNNNVQFLFGADWGFAEDPSTLIRCYILNDCLYIDKEAYGIGIGLNQLDAFYRTIPNLEHNKIMADNSRPETINFMKKKGFWIEGAKKWGGSVEDGIAIMRSFEKIYIHPSCKHTEDEFKFYSYKVDKLSNKVLPVIEDKNNHCIDAIRYALDEVIRKASPMRFKNKKKVSHG